MCRIPIVVLLFVASFTPALRAQSTSASLAGRVTDPSKARIAGAKVIAINAGTNISNEATTNAAGEYYLRSLVPGTYRIEVEKTGFRKLIKPDVILHVQDALNLDFELPAGTASESVTVEGGAPLLNTESASVSTLIDNRFVGNMPLNGRSFRALINLTPGVVLVPTNFFEEGQFSVNGQRPDANYFMVDGVSANLGTPVSSFGQGGTGQLPATNALWRLQQSGFAGCVAGIPDPDFDLRSRVWTHARCADFSGDKIRHQRAVLQSAPGLVLSMPRGGRMNLAFPTTS